MKSSFAGGAIAFAIILGACYVAGAVIQILLVSILATILLDPGVRFLQRLRVPQALAAFLMVCVMVGAVYLAFLVLYARTQEFAGQLPRYYQVVRRSVLAMHRTAAQLKSQTERVVPPVEEEPQQVVIVEHPTLAKFLPPALAESYNVLLAVSFIPFLIFFMLNWKGHIYRSFLEAFEEARRQEVAKNIDDINAVMRRFLLANLVLGLVLSALSAVLFLAFDLQYSLILGLISGFVTLIPYLGAILAIVPPLLVAMDQLRSLGPYLILVGGMLAIHLVGLNLILPKLFGATVNVNPLVLTIAILVWGWMWGAMGLILAVPIMAGAKAIFENIPSMKPYAKLIGNSS